PPSPLSSLDALSKTSNPVGEPGALAPGGWPPPGANAPGSPGFRRSTQRAEGRRTSLHVQKRIARQQHLTEIGPHLARGVGILLVNGLLSGLEPTPRRRLVLTRRTAVCQPKRARQSLLGVWFLAFQAARERLGAQPC